MKLHRSLYLPAALMVALVGCHKSDDTSTPTVTPRPAASGTATVSTATTTTITAGTTTVSVPAATATALLQASGGAAIKVDVSLNEPAKQPAAALTALGTTPANTAQTAIWVISVTKATPSVAPEGETLASEGMAPTSEASAAITYTWEIQATGTGTSVYFVWTVNGQTYSASVPATKTANGWRISFEVPAGSGLPTVVVKELLSLTGTGSIG